MPHMDDMYIHVSYLHDMSDNDVMMRRDDKRSNYEPKTNTKHCSVSARTSDLDTKGKGGW